MVLTQVDTFYKQAEALACPAAVSETEKGSVSLFFPFNCPPEAEFLDEIITYLHLIQEITLLCGNLASFTSQGKSSITGLSDDGSVYELGRHLTVPLTVCFLTCLGTPVYFIKYSASFPTLLYFPFFVCVPVLCFN